MIGPGAEALAARRSHVVPAGPRRAAVLEVDATEDPAALAVLQAGLAELPEGARLGYGYDVTVTGLGAWVGDRKVRISLWPALQDADGTITAEDPDDPDADVLVIDVDPTAHAEALAVLATDGVLVVAGPEGGPVPLVADLDPSLVADALDRCRHGGPAPG